MRLEVPEYHQAGYPRKLHVLQFVPCADLSADAPHKVAQCRYLVAHMLVVALKQAPQVAAQQHQQHQQSVDIYGNGFEGHS